MNIVRDVKPRVRYKQLYEFPVGTVVRLRSRLNKNMNADDPMLIVDMQSYRLFPPHKDQDLDESVVLINLVHARLSCVCNSREAIEIDAEVHTS